MPTISFRWVASSTKALPNGAFLVRCPSAAIEAIMADVLRPGLFDVTLLMLFIPRLVGIKNVDRLLPLTGVNTDEVIFLALFEEGHAFAHQRIEQDDARLGIRMVAGDVER